PQQPNQEGWTTVTLQVRFRGMQASASASNVFAKGTVTIDSRGLFDVQLHAGVKVVADIGAGVWGHFWVAWAPLDLGFEVEACIENPQGWNVNTWPDLGSMCTGSELFWGQLRMHIWQGQGWQHKYSWLPDDDAIHVASRFTARLNIPAGAI